MTPLRRFLAVVAAAIVAAVAIAAFAPGAAPPTPGESCSSPGWTAYAPLDDADPAFLSVCSGDPPPPPEGWPPGAQPPAG
jgi:hypothetical protein